MSLSVLHGVLDGCDPSVSADGTIRVLAGSYVNNGAVTSVSAQNFTAVSGDATFDRYDTLIATSSGAISSVTGIADGNLLQADSTDVIIGRFIMRAGATTVAAADFSDTRVFVRTSQHPYIASSRWVTTPGVFGASTNTSTDTMYLSPIPVAYITSYQRIACSATTAATGSGSIRLGAYQDDGFGNLTLLVDSGSLSTTAAGAISASIAITANPPFVWVGSAQVSALAGMATIDPQGYGPALGSANLIGAGSRGSVKKSSVSGALPSSVVLSSLTDNNVAPPAVYLLTT